MASAGSPSRSDLMLALEAALDACPARSGCVLAFDDGVDGLVVRCFPHGTTHAV